ncbi:hypothetical protein [Noviherbaspirillum sp. ST9]|uniref:hypothetical protein n=1 Tax=Noviherbaspirillum sp. ST9 TaxID=3401606 RepID=UPI003B585D06
MRTHFGTIAILATALSALPMAFSGVMDDVSRLQQEWERVKYQTPPPEQEREFARLSAEAESLVVQNPRRAEVLIWHGIVAASHAGAKGGLGALSLVKAAKQDFEQALEINPEALSGSAYTSLGSLYYQVPGWPLGFGDDKKAFEYLRKGLSINPDGIDPNYFYGDFLYRKGDLDGAERALKKAMTAPPRPGRRVADEGRRREAAELLEKIAEKRK